MTDQSEEEGGMRRGDSTGEGTCTEDEFADTLEAPVIHEINPSTVNTTPGQRITIQASFTSDEKPSIEWRKGVSLLKTGEILCLWVSDKTANFCLQFIFMLPEKRVPQEYVNSLKLSVIRWNSNQFYPL
jgi:hypothetical protein